MVIEMISIDVPGLMTILATTIMAYVIICFLMGIVATIYIYFRYLFVPESIEPYLRIVALSNPQKYREYIDYFGLEASTDGSTVKPLFFSSLTIESNYVGED